MGHRYWIAVVFFLLGMAPGFWVPVLPNILKVRGMEWLIPIAFMAPPLASILSPLIFGASADQRFSAQKLLGTLSLAGAGALFMAFWSLHAGWHWGWFVALLFVNTLISAPMWSLLTTIGLGALEEAEKSFPVYRAFGTVGWVASGVTVSYILSTDADPVSGMAAAVVRVAVGLLAFLLPHTPPRGEARHGWKSAFGLDALSIFRDRDNRVYFWTMFLLSIPLSAFYMYTPRHLQDLGTEKVAGLMTLGQWGEILALLLLARIMLRCRVKSVLVFAIACAVARYAFFAVAGWTGQSGWLVPGIALHGICFTFFFITGQIFLDRRVDVGLKAQAQALLQLVSFGFGSLLGAGLVGLLYWLMVDSSGAQWGGWSGFWWLLTAMCVLAGIVFVAGYKGTGAAPGKEQEGAA